MKAFIPILALATAVYTGLCAWLYVNQRNMLYFPRPEVHVDSAEPLWLETADARLKIWSVAGTGPEAIVYFGGNAESVHLNIDSFREWFPEHSVYLVNYRGYGGSSGTPNEADLCADAAVIYDYLRVRHSRISAIGRSLGSGVAACLASERELVKLALVTPFDSIRAVASDLYPFLPVSALLHDSFDSAARAPAIDADVLIMLASEDEIIPREHGYSLARAFAPDQVDILEIQGADHIDISEFAAYGEGLREFL
jgi:pimeloyl-ACP methyl ester carboxylesterase